MKSFLERFWSKVDVGDEDECWWWTAALNSKGYGSFRVNDRWVPSSHVVAYELQKGEEVPPGWDVDHTCHNRDCQNGAHFELVPKVAHGMQHAYDRWAPA